MQFSNIATVLALAMTASALPAAESVDKLTARTEPSCSNNQQLVCCNGLLGLLGLCNIAVLGTSCEGGSSYCCSTNGAPVSLTLLITGIP
jgi:hypothetical protein